MATIVFAGEAWQQMHFTEQKVLTSGEHVGFQYTMLAMGRYNHRLHKARALLFDPALLDAIGIDCDISDLPPHSSQAARQSWGQMQIDDELDVCMDASTYVRAFIGRRCASLSHHDHAYPGLLAPLTREDSASRQLGLAMAARTWRVIAFAEKDALSNQSIARLLHRVAFVNSTLVRESLLAVAHWPGEFLPQPHKDSIDTLVKGWGQRCVTENGFNRCKDHQLDNKNLRMARAARRRYLKDSNVFENVYKRKEIVVEPTNFGGKGRFRLNKALYESQSGEPSVTDGML